MLELVGIVAGFAAVVALYMTFNRFSGDAMDRIDDEAKSVSHRIGWFVVWIVLAGLAALVVMIGMGMSKQVAESQSPPPRLQTR
jgi:uncharacterized membrane protein YfcA